MIDRDTKNKIKQKANELSDICVEDGAKYAEEYKKLYDEGMFNCGECFLLVKLVDLYTAIKTGVIDKKEGVKRQKEILDIVEFTD